MRRRLVASSVLALGLAAAPARAAHPPDPFAADYEVPREREVGATAGQVRAVGSPLLAYGRDGVELGLQGSLELMTFAYLGVRSSLESTLLRPSGGPMLLAGKVGPSLHLFPYRRFDVALFFEAGVAGVDLTGQATAMPIVAPGGALDLWLASWAFLEGEAHADWGIYGSQDGAAHGYLRFVATGGLGLAM